MKPVPRPALLIVFLLLFAGVPILSAAEIGAATKEGVQITQLADKLRVEINGKLFTEYLFTGVPRPCYFPVIGPGDAFMTRNFPLKDAPNEEHDHKHHRSLWFSHFSVNGQDTWTEGKGTIVHTGFDEIKSGKDAGVIRSQNKWLGTNGAVLCTDERTFRVYNRPGNERVFDFEITIHASNGELTFGDDKDGVMGVRLAETMRLKPNQFNKDKPTGHIVNSEGIRDGEAWGKRANWVDYHGPVNVDTVMAPPEGSDRVLVRRDQEIVGLAIFDHPQNPRHPTWWHVRDYGLFAANPFGQAQFEKLPDKKAGNMVIPAGKSVTFRYRFYIHEGDEKQAKVAERYAEYSK